MRDQMRRGLSGVAEKTSRVPSCGAFQAHQRTFRNARRSRPAMATDGLTPTTRKRPVSYPHSITIRLTDRQFRRLNACSDNHGVARAILCCEWIEARLALCCAFKKE